MKATAGWCLKCEDGMKGDFEKINNMSESNCLKKCKSVHDAKGCEYASKISTCVVYKHAVSTGNGNAKYGKCWSIANSCQGKHYLSSSCHICSCRVRENYWSMDLGGGGSKLPHFWEWL